MDDIKPAAKLSGPEHQTDTGTSPAPRRRTPWNTLEGRVISLVSRKGGVGKTTSAVNLGAALALSGHSVLIIGTDPQCGVCRTLGTEPAELPTSLTDIFTDRTGLNEIAQRSPLENLFFISPRLLSLADEEAYHEAMASRMDDFVREVDRARNLYDTILIDCPPSLGAPTRAALAASDSYLVPVQAEELCRGTLGTLIEFVGDFQRKTYRSGGPVSAGAMPQTLALEGLFLTMTSERTRMGRHVAARVSEDFGNDLLECGIPRNTRLSEMALRGKPAVIYDRRSSGSRAYFDLADELVRRYCRNPDCGIRSEAPLVEPDPEDLPASSRTPTPQEAEVDFAREASTGLAGLGRFLAELRGGGPADPGIAPFDEPALPEMVSLDDLLAEEEGRCDRRDDGDDSWAYGFDTSDPLN
ncbi:MAG: ParA family protein [bacterium]